MSDKRFVQCEIEYGFANTTNIKKIDGVYDMQEEKTYRIEQIVDKLNEQQATITHLEKVNGKNFAKRKLLEQDNLVLRNENEQLKNRLNKDL